MEYFRNNFLSRRDGNRDIELGDLESGTSGASSHLLPAEVDMQLDGNEKRQMEMDLPIFEKVRVVSPSSRLPTLVSVYYL